ncbi:MAG: sigma-70 family RNA polymerase sigma factor [Acidobacteria bacterium]|nr:sigma-70 family RNA polymerase sigma factor [Acidobacteriota bacterium]
MRIATVSLRALESQKPPPRLKPRHKIRPGGERQATEPASNIVGRCHQADEDELLLQHLSQVRAIALQIRRRFHHADIDDLVADGTLGLLKAIRSFDGSRGVLLKTYAEYRIRGEILDGLRTMRWLSRRACRNQVQVFTFCSANLEELEEVAQQCGWSGGSAPDPGTIYDAKERTQLLAKAISRLPQRSREVIEMRYHRELNWKQIVQLLNEREWKVYDLHDGALRLLRRSLARKKVTRRSAPAT